MLAQLEQRFAFLVSRQRDVPARHRTLRAAIDGSYQLLDPELRQFFARLSVFRGGWTLEAAAAVCSGVQAFGYSGVRTRPEPTDAASHRDPNTRTPEPLNTFPPEEVLDALLDLRDASLIIAEEAGEAMRFRMLETLREYAWEQLAASGEQAAVRDRHRDWCLHLADAVRSGGERSPAQRLAAASGDRAG